MKSRQKCQGNDHQERESDYQDSDLSFQEANHSNGWMIEQLGIGAPVDCEESFPHQEAPNPEQIALSYLGKLDTDGSPPPKAVRRPSKGKMGAGTKKEKGVPFIQGANDTHALDYDDVLQGSIYDCYFLAGLAALAHKHPDLLRDRIQDNGDGTYGVTLFVRDSKGDLAPKVFQVTAPAEVTENGKTYRTARTGDRKGNKVELWVRLFEAAFMQYQGGPSAIKLGGGAFGPNGVRALESLTGNHPQGFHIGQFDARTLVELISGALGRDDIVTAYTHSAPKSVEGRLDATKISDHLYGNHRYTVLSINKDEVGLYDQWGGEPKVPLEEFRKAVSGMQIVSSRPPGTA